MIIPKRWTVLKIFFCLSGRKAPQGIVSLAKRFSKMEMFCNGLKSVNGSANEVEREAQLRAEGEAELEEIKMILRIRAIF